MTTSVRERLRDENAGPPEAPRRPAALSGALAAGIVYGSGVVLSVGLAMIVWLASDAGSASAAMRAGTGFWLAGHGSGVSVGETTITVVPLGVPLLVALATAVASHRLGDGEGVAALAGGAAATYGAALAVTAMLAGSSDVSFSPVRAGVIGAAIAGVSALVGAAAVDGGLRDRWNAAPEVVRGVVAGGMCAIAAVLVAAFGLVAYGLVMSFGEMMSTVDALGPGFLGGATLVLLCILALPNAVLFAAAVLLGPGFAFGSDTSVTLTQVRLGDVPAVPLLAALPDPGDQPAWVAALGALPVLAGIVGGVVAVRGAMETLTLYDALGRGCTAGGAAGVVLGLTVMAAGGAAGPGRMADVGAVVWCVPIAVLAMAVGGTVGGLAGHYRERRSQEPAA